MTVKNHINRSLRSITVFLMLSGVAATASAAEGNWALTANNMGAWHSIHNSVTLPDGRVAVIGSYEYGPYTSDGPQEGEGGYIEIYDPATGEWTRVASMSAERERPESVLLDDGRVLVAGNDSAEIYDPDTDTWTPAGTLNSDAGDVNFGLVKLADGKVYAVGGSVGTGGTASVEVFDLNSYTWQPVASMNHGRSFHVTVAIENGTKILAAGGLPFEARDAAEVYDPATDTWTPTPDLAHGRDWASATRLNDGRVFVSGTLEPQQFGDTAEIYTP